MTAFPPPERLDPPPHPFLSSSSPHRCPPPDAAPEGAVGPGCFRRPFTPMGRGGEFPSVPPVLSPTEGTREISEKCSKNRNSFLDFYFGLPCPESPVRSKVRPPAYHERGESEPPTPHPGEGFKGSPDQISSARCSGSPSAPTTPSVSSRSSQVSPSHGDGHQTHAPPPVQLLLLQ